MRKLDQSNKAVLPTPWPTFLVKAMWQGTSKKLLIPAKSEADAWDRAWKQIAREEGGDLCLRVEVLERR